MSVLIALGANRDSHQGPPSETLRWVLRGFTQFGLRVNRLSRFYVTAPVGAAGQPDYVNAVVEVFTTISPKALINMAKQFEYIAGRKMERRRVGERWVARPLDIDILDYKGKITKNHSQAVADPQKIFPLVLPHPRIEWRPFVAAPLAEIVPRWHHPVTHRSAEQIWRRLSYSEQGRVLRRLD